MSNRTNIIKIWLLGLCAVLLFSSAHALYNDIGNDSCFTIYAANKDNFCPQGQCQIDLTLENNCGSVIPDADLGIFLKNELISKILPQKIYRWNGSDWTDITAVLVQATDAQNIPVGKSGFTLLRGWKDVSIPQGAIRLLLVFKVLTPTDGEFIIAGRSRNNQIYISRLDPIFRSAFFDFSIPSDYTTFNTTVTGGYCTLSAGKLDGYCDTNFLTPSPNVMQWRNMNTTANWNNTRIQTVYHDNTREDVNIVNGTLSYKMIFQNEGRYGGTYDVNSYLAKELPQGRVLNVYVCKDGYVTGNFITDSNCFLARIFDPTEFAANATFYWLSFSFDANKIGDTNNVLVIYDCNTCDATKYYRIGVDTSSAAQYSYKSTNAGTTWGLTVNRLMIGLWHRASGKLYQYSTDGTNWNYIYDKNSADKNLMAVPTAPNQIKIRVWLKRYSTAYDVNIDSIDINYTNNSPPSIPTLTAEPDTNLNWAQVQWNASTDPENDPIQYSLRIGTGSGLNNIADINTASTDYNKTLLPNGTYYWGVKSCDDANGWFAFKTNCFGWSSEDIFTISNNPPSTPMLVDEPNGQTEGSVLLNWAASTDPEGDAIHYVLHVGTYSGGKNIVDVNTTNQSYSTPYLGAGTYYWSVTACDATHNCNTSTEDTFIIAINYPPSVPTLFAQPDNEHTTRSFDWNASTDGENNQIRYTIQVGTSLGGKDKLDANIFNTDYNNFNLNSAGTYYWQVRACDSNYGDWNNCSGWAIDSFIIQSNEPPSVPVQTAQPDDSNTIRSFDWLASADSEGNPIRYTIQVGTGLGLKDKLDANTFNTDYNNFDLISTGTYYWQVRACDSNYGDWNNCSGWATDGFNALGGGAINIHGFVLNVRPTAEGFTVTPQLWRGVGAVWASYFCADPNGATDLNTSRMNVAKTGGTDFNISADLNNGSVLKDIASYFSEEGVYTITPVCIDNNGNFSINDTGHQFFYATDMNLSINNGDADTNSLIVDLYIYAPIAHYMAFSCDANNWTGWVLYDTFYPDWDMASGNYGCASHGEGIYTTYALFLDGADNIYGVLDTIYARGVPTTLEAYQNPDEKELPTAYFALATGDIAWGLLFIVGLIGVTAFFAIKKRRNW